MGESSFWYRPTRVVPDQKPLNGRCCCCCCCILFSACFGKNLCRKWTVEKKVYINYMLQACEIMHIVGGPLQRNDVLTFSLCLNWIEVICCCHSIAEVEHLIS